MKEDKFKNNFGVNASDSLFSNLPVPEMPKQVGNKVVTLNKKGFMRVEIDPFSLLWVNEAGRSELPFLEIGAAYGQSSIAALDKGATIIANDISLDHLLVLRNRANPLSHHRLYINQCSFPFEMELANNSLGGVLFCRVGHFFTGEELEKSFEKIYNWLIPEGKVYFVGISPYHYTLRDDFLPKFLEKKKQNQKYPGYIDNMRQYLPRSSEEVPCFMHALDPDTISTLLNKEQFEIKEARLFDYSTNNSDEKGFVGLIAIKKS